MVYLEAGGGGSEGWEFGPESGHQDFKLKVLFFYIICKKKSTISK